MKKLPKQWLHWAASMHLKPEISGKYRYRGFYLKGRGRRWRVNMHGEFQCSKPESQFDRWANSWHASTVMPKTHKEFQEFVRYLENSE